MTDKFFYEIEKDISKTCLSDECKDILNSINKMLCRYKNKKNLDIPILILTKNIDNIDVKHIENLISKMLEKYNVYGGELKETFKAVGVSPNKLITTIGNHEAYKFSLDKVATDMFSTEQYFKVLEKLVDTKSSLILVECMIDVENVIYTNSIFNKIDYIFSNANTIENISELLIARYKYNNISTELDIDSLEQVVKNNLEANVYETSENCLQYMFTKSVKSYMSSNRRKLKIDDIPVIEHIDKVIENLDEECTKENVLDGLTGLEYIKEELDKIIKFAVFNKKAREKNEKLPKENLNMCFLGNPGTGKTTIARAIANELYKNHLIEKNKVTEILPNDLMGAYVGQTKKAARENLNKAKGGILFIDEAYQIVSPGYRNGNPYMNEALTELLKYMEDPNNIVIFAGYKDEIENMLNMNPGIKSRIPIRLEFKDYEIGELKKVLDNELKLYDLKLDEEANKLVLENISKAKKNFDFGNCRYVKNLALEIIKNHSYNNSQSIVITAESIPEYIEKTRKTIGFKMEVVNG